MSRHDDASEKARADMTPMIDVVFLLIIFFLCIDFKTLEAKLPAYLPTDSGSQRDRVAPVEQLALRIELVHAGEKQPRRESAPRIDPLTGRENPYLLVGHRVRYRLGPQGFDELPRLVEALERIAADPEKRVPNEAVPGQTKLMTVVIEPGPGTTYGDVASTVDAVSEAGFEEIRFAGGRGTTD